MKLFSFIHTADLHLDSPFNGITADSSYITNVLRSATFDTLDHLIKLAIEKRVQLLLIAGDVYDSADRSLRAQLKFRDGLERLSKKNIRTFVAHGNHDPLDGWSSSINWPSGVHIFGPQVEEVIVKSNGSPVVSVSGMSYQRKNEKRNLARLFKRSEALNIFHIGLLHCSVGSHPVHETYAPCELSDLLNSGFNYWALGHVHERIILNENPHVIYPGNTQGRHIREQNERGCYLVDVYEDHSIDIEFYPIDAVRWRSVSINIENMNSIDQLDSIISDSIDKLREEADPRPVVCHIILTGRGPLYNDLRKEGTVMELQERAQENHSSELPFVLVQKIKMNCRPMLDIDSLRKNKDFIGQIIRISDEFGSEDDKIVDVLEPVLSELYANPRLKKAVSFPTIELLKEIFDESKLFCIDQLEKE